VGQPLSLSSRAASLQAMNYGLQSRGDSDCRVGRLQGLAVRTAGPPGTRKIHARLRRLSLGNPGDVKAIGGGISELRIDYGPGYRVYLQQRGPCLVVLLIGGDKRTQRTDIEWARVIAADWSE
jgi:putative addiction module killer protein